MADKKPGKAKHLSRRRLLKRAVGGALAAGAVYSVGTSQVLDVTRLKVEIARLPAALDGLRVAFASDFHLGPHFPVEKVRASVDTIASLGADMILLGGDYVTRSREYMVPSLSEISRLGARYGVYAVPGNHDYWAGISDFHKAVSGTSITDLTNRGLPVSRAGEILWIAGLDDLWGGDPDAEAALAGKPKGAACIVLCHNPYSVDDLPPGSADLVLAGHTHGWQVYVPLLTRAFIPRTMSRYRCGLYDTPAGPLYVTRGVGMISPPLRLWCRPEVVLIELQSPAGKSLRL
ncbi:MAG: metallophosphoesterase [Planctomycetes bacterium]|nr:metallophosphoesterase [Planctomycetota bacterium]